MRAATRVEYQISRDKLKLFGVDSFEDWIEKRHAIVHRLTHKTFRLTEGPVDHRHADRTQTHPFWQLVQRRFAECYHGSPEADLTPLPSLEIDTSRRMATIVGSFKGMFARVGKPIRDNEHFMREAVFELRSALMDRDMAEEVRRKAIELGVEGL